MKLYNLTLEENKMISAIINDLTKPYKAYRYTEEFQNYVNEGIAKIRKRAMDRGLLLDETDWEIPVKTLKAIVRIDDGKTS